jgi:hypothetical protein
MPLSRLTRRQFPALIGGLNEAKALLDVLT